MFKREIQVNLKNFIIWLTILIVIFLVAFLIYPSIISNDNIKMMDKMMSLFPDDLLKAFNMDISSISSAYGWLKSEGFVFVLLIIGSYSGIMGSNILLKEENDKTIEYLNSLPVKRNDIIISKTLAGLIYITLMIILLGIFNYIGLSLSGEFDKKQYVLLSITPIFPALVIYFICMFLSTFTHKNKKMSTIILGIVLLSYVLYTLSSLSKTTKFLKYFSIFTLADIRNVILNVSIDPFVVIVTIFISSLFFILTIIHYNKKELI